MLAFLALCLMSALSLIATNRHTPAMLLSYQPSTSSQGRAELRSTRLILAFDTALAMTLLVLAITMTRSLIAQEHVETIRAPARLVTGRLVPYKKYRSADARAHFYASVLEGIRSQPHVLSAAATSHMPFSSVAPPTAIVRRADAALAPISGYARYVTEAYFTTCELRLLAGRDFSVTDRFVTEEYAIVNESLARGLQSAERGPLGASVNIVSGGATIAATIIGTVRDSRMNLTTPPRPEVFLLSSRHGPRQMSVLVRTGRSLPEITTALRDIVRNIDVDQPLVDVVSVEDIIGRQLLLPRLRARLATLFASVAAVLSIVGVLSLGAYSVGRRTREIGIRLALGAGRHSVAALLCRGTAPAVFAGLGAGVVLSSEGIAWVTSLVYGIQGAKVSTYIGAGLCAAIIPLLAMALPAYVAAATEPARALRDER